MLTLKPEVSSSPRDSWHFKLGAMVIRSLDYHCTLEGISTFIAVWWGLLTIIFSDFWTVWPVSTLVGKHTFGHPQIVSWLLLCSGVASYISYWKRCDVARSIAALVAFGCWCLLTVTFFFAIPIYSPGVACYSALAAARLVSYVNLQIRREVHRLKIGIGKK